MIEFGEAVKPNGIALSQAEYDLLLENKLPWIGKLHIEKLTPVFDWDPDGYYDSAAGVDMVAHDMCYMPFEDLLIRVWIDGSFALKSQYIQASATGSRSWSTPVTIASGLSTANVRPALWSEVDWENTLNTVWLAYYTGSAIMWTYTTNGYTWNTPESVVSTSQCSGLAIPGTWQGTKAVLFSEYVSASYYSKLRVFLKPSTTWVEENGNFNESFSYQIRGLDAIHADTGHYNWIVVWVADDAPLISLRSVGTVVQTVGYRRSGIWCANLNTRVNALTEPKPVDVIDEAWSGHVRWHPRIERWYGDQVTGSFLMTSLTRDGMQRDNWASSDDWQGISLYWSEDGEHWTNNHLIRAVDTDPGVVTRSVPGIASVVVCENLTYLGSATQLWRAKSTGLLAGADKHADTWFETALDLASGIDWSASEMDQMKITFPAGGSLQSLLLESGDVLAKFYMGVQNGATDILALVKTMVVDTVSRVWTSEEETIDIALRDYLSLWTDRSADNTVELVGTTLGVDLFSELGHVAWQNGSPFTISGGRLRCTASADLDRGVAFFTWRTDLSDGLMKIGFQLDATDSGLQDVSFILRGYDKDNYLAVRYTHDVGGVPSGYHDRFYFVEREGGVDTYVAQLGTGTMGWSRGTWYYIQVRIRRQYMAFYTSTDGYTWTLLATYLLPGYAELSGPIDVLTIVPLMRGAFGVDAQNSAQDKYVTWGWLTIVGGEKFYTLEDVVTEFGSHGGITKYKWRGVMAEFPTDGGVSDLTNFTVESGLWQAWDASSGEPVVYLRGYDATTGRKIIWHNRETPDNFSVEFVYTGDDWGILLRATDTDDWYEVGGDSSYHWIRASVGGVETYNSRVPLATTGLHHIRVAVQEVKFDYSDSDPEWLFLCVYLDGWLINAAALDISGGRPPNELGFCQYAPEEVYYRLIRIPELYDRIQYAVIDANNPIISGIQMAVAQRDLEMHVRFDGTFFMRRNWVKTSGEIDDLELFLALDTTWDKRLHGTHMRMTGGFLIQDQYDTDRINLGGGNRMWNLHNPDLMTPEEIDYELRRALFKMRERAEFASVVMRPQPFLEVGDMVKCASVPVTYGEAWIIESIVRRINAGNMDMTVRCRAYDTLRDTVQSGMKP